MMPKEHDSTSGESLAVFVLLGLFALASVMTVLLCTQLYRKTLDAVQENADKRIVESYLVDAVRTADCTGGVTVYETDGLCVLNLSTGEGDGWRRCIYCYEGVLYEQLTDAMENFELTYGEPISALRELRAECSANMVRMYVTDKQGREEVLCAALICGQEGRTE